MPHYIGDGTQTLSRQRTPRGASHGPVDLLSGHGTTDMCNRMKARRATSRSLGLLAGTLLSLATIACGATTAVPRPFPVPGASGSRTPSPADEILAIEGQAVAETALSLTGRPYRLGGADPSGFDCSGLVQYVFAQHGLGTPRVVDQQVQLGRRLEPDEIGPGDLVFFKVDSRRPSHVGIAIDETRFVHAPRTGSLVRVDALDAPYWRTRYAEARRIEIPPSGGAVLTLRDETP